MYVTCSIGAMNHTFYHFQQRKYSTCINRLKWRKRTFKIENGDTSHFISSTRLPFNWKNPMGYLVALLIESLVSFSLSIIGALPIFYFCGLCWILASFVLDIASDMARLTDQEIKKSNQRNPKQMKMTFLKIIREISHTKQLSVNNNHVISL